MMEGEGLSLFHHTHSTSLVGALEGLLKNGAFVDCILAAEGKSLKAHKVILSASSPYFQALFSHDNDKLPILFLKDVQYEYLELIIDFIYCGRVKISDTQLNTFLDVAKSLQIKGLDSGRRESDLVRSKPYESLSPKNGEKLQLSKNVAEDKKEDNDCKVLEEVIDVIDVDERNANSEPSNKQVEKQTDIIEDSFTCTIQSTYSLAPDEISPTQDLVDDSMDAESNIINVEVEEENNESDRESCMFDAESIHSRSSIRADSPVSVISSIAKTESLSDLYAETENNSADEVTLDEDDMNEAVSVSNKNVSSPTNERSSSPVFEAVEVISDGVPRSKEDPKGSHKLVRAASFRRHPGESIQKYSEGTGSHRTTSTESDTGRIIVSYQQNEKFCWEQERTSSCKRLPGQKQPCPEDSDDCRVTIPRHVTEKKFVSCHRTEKPCLGLKKAASYRKILGKVMRSFPVDSGDHKVTKLDTLTETKSCTQTEKLCPELERDATSRKIPVHVMQSDSGDSDNCRATSPEPVAEKKKKMSFHQTKQPYVKIEKITNYRKILGQVTQPDLGKSNCHKISFPESASEKKTPPCLESEQRCPVCSKFIMTPGYMKLHMRIHTGEKPHNCSQCPKSFCQLQNLRRHMLTHTGERPYSCPKCNKSFAQAGHLKTHELIHSGRRRFTCGECNRSFIQRVHLKNHILIHTGEKSNVCPKCLKTFNRLSSLKRHLSIHTK